MDQRCTHCNGTLVLSADRRRWICEYCDSEFAVKTTAPVPQTSQGRGSANVCYIGPVKATPEAIRKINLYLSANQKLAAIKFVREYSGLGLPEAMAWIDNYRKRH